MQPTIEHSAPAWRAQGEAGLPVADLLEWGKAEGARLTRLMQEAEAGRHEPYTPVVEVSPSDVADSYVGDFRVVISVGGKPVTGGEFINIAAFRAFVQLMWEQRCAETPMETCVGYDVGAETPTELAGFALQDVEFVSAMIDTLLEPATPGADPSPLDVTEGEATLVDLLRQMRGRLAGAACLIKSAGQSLDDLLELGDADCEPGQTTEAVFSAADNDPSGLVDGLADMRNKLTGKPTDDDAAAAQSEAHEPAALHAD